MFRLFCTALLGMLFSAGGVPAQILGNGGFEYGLLGWTTNVSDGGAATFSVVAGPTHTGSHALKIAVANSGSVSNSIQLRHTTFTASATNTYVLRFWASSDVNFARMSVELQGATPVYPQIPFQISTNNNSYQEYLYAFRGAGDISICFNFQNATNNYYLDDVEVLDVNNTNGWDVPLTYVWRWGQLDYARTNSVGWGSADNDKSVELPDGSVLWIFNDTWTTTLNNFYSNIQDVRGFPRNSVVHQVGTNLYLLSTATFFVPTNPANLFWIGGCLVESNEVQVVLSEINATSITRVGTAIGTISLPDLKLKGITYIPSPGADDYNQVVKGEDGYYYIYWTTNTSSNPFAPNTQVQVARTPIGQLKKNAAWQYWDAFIWQSDHTQAAPLPNLVAPWSFTQLGPSNYVAVYMPQLSLTINAQFAPSPLGPWTKPVPVFETAGEWGELNYMPNICAGTGSNGVYTIGYSDNGSPDGLIKVTDRSFYCPHFVKADLRRLSPYTPFTLGSNYLLQGTLIGTTGSATGSNTRDRVFDGNLGSYFDAPTGSGAWVGWDLGTNNDKVVTTIRYCPRSGYASRMVGGVFQGADNANFIGAVNLYTVPSAPLEGFFTPMPLTKTTAYRYVRYRGPNNGYCNVAELEFYGASVPPAPDNLAAIPGDHQVQLTWAAVPGATGYNLKRTGDDNNAPVNILTGGTNLDFVDTGLNNGVTYHYTVSAQVLSLESSNSLPVDVIPNGPPDVPGDVIALAGTNHTVTLEWTALPEVEDYLVRRASTSGGPYAEVATVSGGAYTDAGLVNGSTYYYRIAATNAFGLSADSEEVNAEPGGYVSWALAAGAAAYWRLNETGGVTAHDILGAHPGTHGAGVALGWSGVVADGLGAPHYAAHYNGSGVSTEVPAVIGTGSFSLAFWVRTTATGGTPNWTNGLGLVDGSAGGMANDFGTALVGGQFAFGVGNPTYTVLSGTNINDGVWHFVVAARNAATGIMLVYVDGQLQKNQIGPTGARQAPGFLRIGGLQTGAAGHFFIGELSDVAAFNQFLIPAAVTNLYHAGAGIFYDLTLTTAWENDHWVLTWPGGGTLLEADELAGPWTVVPAATSPYPVPATNTHKFFRVQIE